MDWRANKNHAREHLDALFAAARRLDEDIHLAEGSAFTQPFFEATDRAVQEIEEARASMARAGNPTP